MFVALLIVLTVHGIIGKSAQFRCPSTLVDGQGAVELEVAPTSEGYSVKWNTHHTFYVDYINLEAVCSIQGKESTEPSTILLQLSTRLVGSKNVTVETGNNEVIQCKIFGCFIDSDWGDFNSIEPVTIIIGNPQLPSLSPSPTSSPPSTPISNSMMLSSSVDAVPTPCSWAAAEHVSKREAPEEPSSQVQLNVTCNKTQILIALYVLICVIVIMAIVITVLAVLLKTMKLKSNPKAVSTL